MSNSVAESSKGASKKLQNSKQKEMEDEAVRAEEERLRQTALISSTFANMELQTTKLTLAQYTGLYQQAREDVSKLQRELGEREREHAQGMRHLQDRLDAATKSVKQTEITANERVEQAKRGVAEEHENLKVKIATLEDTISGLRETNERHLADLDALNAFKRERQEIHKELANYKQRQAEISVTHEEQISALKFAALEERVRLKAEEKALKERFDEDVQKKAEGMLDARTTEIHEENKLVVNEKQTLQIELSRIAKENRRLISVNNEQRRELSLLKGGEEEFAKRCASQLRVIKSLREQVTALEANAERTVGTYEKKIHDLQLATTHRVSTLEVERDNAIRNAEGRHKELSKMRLLARSVVRQRTELETFFSEAFDYVRREIAKERQQQGITATITSPQHQARIAGRATQNAIETSERRLITMRESNSVAAPPRTHDAHPIFASLTPRGNATNPRGATSQLKRNTATSLVLHPSRASQEPSSVPNLPSIRSNRTPSSPPLSTENTPSKHPSRRRNSMADGDGEEPAEGGKDIADLSWTDKERVLRILFAKINGKDQQAAALDQQSYDESVGRALAHSVAKGEQTPTKLLGDKEGTTFFTQNM